MTRLDRDTIEARLSEVYADGRTVTGWSYKQHVSALLTALDVAEKALQAGVCTNCDDRGCMSCVLREEHDACVDDCPLCALDDGAVARRVALAIIRGQADLPDPSEVPGKASE